MADEVIITNKIRNLIYTLRNKQIMIDSDLAEMYQVETKSINRAMKRNINRFPSEFCFQLTEEEYFSLRCQNGTSNEKRTQGGRRYLPYAFFNYGEFAIIKSQAGFNRFIY